MSDRWNRLVAFLNAEEDARPQALVRILTGLTIVAHLSRFVLSGAADFALMHQENGGLSLWHGWLEPLGGATPSLVHALCGLTVVAAACATVGLRTRPALVVTWLGVRAISSLNPSARGSYDSLLVDTLFVLLLSGCGRAWSLDAAWRGEGGPAKRWTRVLLVVQLALVYTGSGLSKASSSWVPGGDASALWYILQQPTWSRIGELPLWAYPVTQAATTLTWLFEIAGVLFLFAVLLDESEPRGRGLAALRRGLARIRFVEVYLAFGLALHLGIELTMEVGPFSFATLALYPAALGPTRIGRIARAIRARARRSAPHPSKYEAT
ncbi:MAG TPA: HTTM domain-containing protein [Sandaracinaceae bacterium LLY-WYZ-13_1]|nr:HTTM domain-containing protein [Sandaracinaceae bacterium LLY-WYZ-13_1]